MAVIDEVTSASKATAAQRYLFTSVPSLMRRGINHAKMENLHERNPSQLVAHVKESRFSPVLIHADDRTYCLPTFLGSMQFPSARR